MGDWLKVLEDLRASPLFSTLSDSVLERYSLLIRSREYNAGDSIYRDGEPAHTFFLIRHGKVKITRTSSEGDEMIVAFYGRGDFVGCCCVLDAARFPCHARTTEPTELLCISREDLLKILQEEPGLAVRMLQETTKRLYIADRRMKDLALDTVERRVVAVLLDLNERFGTDAAEGARLIRLRITRLELAEMAGTTLETASRVMSKLRRAGWVQSSSSRRGIVLLEPQTLAQFIA